MPCLETRIRHLRLGATDRQGAYDTINRYNTVRLCPPPEDKLNSLDHGEGRYRYKFKPAPRQNDIVIYYIKLAIRELSTQNLGVANMNFRVAPTDKSPPFWPPFDDFPTYCSKLYTFMDDYNEFPLTAWVTFFPREAGLTTDTLYFKIGTEWVSLKQWLLSKATPEDELVRKKGFRAQRLQWRFNRMNFSLFDLPVELRLKIFEFALGPRIYPLSTVSSDAWSDPVARERAEVRMGLGFYNWHERGGPRQPSWLFSGYPHTVAGCSAYEPNVALLQANRQTYEEGLQAGWENTRKCFFSARQLTSVLDAGVKPNYNWLNHIILDFTMRGWFDFFGIETCPFHMESESSLGYILGTFTNLKTLQLWFSSPGDGWDYSPWSGRGPYICCQRTMVDWIMTFAWPFLKDLRNVTVTIGGVVKKDSKVKWDGLLALPTARKANIVDQVAEETAIFSTPEALMPPPCSCRTLCVANDASRYSRELYPELKKDDFDYEEDV